MFCSGANRAAGIADSRSGEFQPDGNNDSSDEVGISNSFVLSGVKCPVMNNKDVVSALSFGLSRAPSDAEKHQCTFPTLIDFGSR